MLSSVGIKTSKAVLTVCDDLILTGRIRHTHLAQLLVRQSQAPASVELWAADFKCTVSVERSVRVDWSDQVIPEGWTGDRLLGWGTLILSMRQ